MRRITVIVALLALCLTPARAAQANDLVDLKDSLVGFLEDTLCDPQGISTEFVTGDVANALALTLSAGDRRIKAKLIGIQSMYVAHNLGFTINIAGSDAPRFQPIVGLSARVTNIKGTELRIGVRAVSADISQRKLQTPDWWPGFLPSIEIPYAWVAELRRPL